MWRALHVQIDPPPHVLEDEIGLKLIAPPENWQARPDMNPAWTSRIRASMVARARFVEDLLAEKVKQGVAQYVLLGAGIDTFAQRNPTVASRLKIFEIDRPEPQEWKRQRLKETGYGLPPNLKFVAVNFENQKWWDQLLNSGFDESKPALIASTGVSMYLTLQANQSTLQQLAQLPTGSAFVMSFLRPLELIDKQDQAMTERAIKGAAASGTPFVSFFAPADLIKMAQSAGFKDAQHISKEMLIDRYFKNRKDGLQPSNGEELLLATT